MSDDAASVQELRSAAVHGVRWSSLSRPAAEALQLVSVVVLARLVAPAEFGHYAVALIAQEAAFMLIASGIGLAIIQRKVLDRAHMEAGVALSLIGGLALTLAMLAASSLIFAPIFGARTALFVRLICPLCLISGINAVPSALLSRRMSFRRLSEIEVLGTLLRVVAAIGLALAGLGGEALIFGTLIGVSAATALACASAPPPSPRLHRAAARDLLRVGLPVSLSSVGWIGFSNVDYAIIGARLGTVQTAMYFRAYTLAVEYQAKIGVVMNQVGFPVLARTGSEADLAQLRRQMVRALTIVLFPLLALLAILAPVLVPFVFGPNWAPATVPVQILALGGAATLVINAVGTVLMAKGRTRALLGFGMAHFILYGLAVLAVVGHGIVAVAIAAAVVHTGFLFVAYALMLRGSAERPLRRLCSDLAPASVCCAGLALPAVPLRLALASAHAPAIVQITAVGCAGIAAYLLAMRLLYPAIAARLRAAAAQVLGPAAQAVRRAPRPALATRSGG
jgi:O-antigen/teichoic acid export membrane protein